MYHSYKLWFLYFFSLLVFRDIITTKINNNSKVMVIATSKSRDSLHPSVLTSRGCHIFQCCVELHPPDSDQRKQILCAMIKKRFPLQDPEGLELRYTVTKMEWFWYKVLILLLSILEDFERFWIFYTLHFFISHDKKIIKLINR